MPPPPTPDEPDRAPLLGAALQLAVSRQPAAWVCWAALAALLIGLDLVARRAGVPLDGDPATAAFWTYAAVKAVFGAAISGVALHVLLTGRPPPRLDGGFFAFVALMAGGEMFWSVCVTLVFPGPGDTPQPAQAAAMLALLVLGIYVFCRLALWPVGLLLGDPRMSLAAAWRRMHGYVARYVAATLLITIPPTFLIALVMAAPAGPLGQPGTFATGLMTRIVEVALTAALTALLAVVYRRRAGLADEALA